MRLSHALIQNRAGQFVAPEHASFQAAAASADWGRTSDFYLLLTDGSGENAYPITATVFVLMHKTASRNRTRAALDFFRWSLENGSRSAAAARLRAAARAARPAGPGLLGPNVHGSTVGSWPLPRSAATRWSPRLHLLIAVEKSDLGAVELL